MSEKITKFIEEIKTLTILELRDLVKAIEEEFGVSAAPVAVAADLLPDLLPDLLKSRQNSLLFLRKPVLKN